MEVILIIVNMLYIFYIIRLIKQRIENIKQYKKLIYDLQPPNENWNQQVHFQSFEDVY